MLHARFFSSTEWGEKTESARQEVPSFSILHFG